MSREQIMDDILAALTRVDATQLTYIYKILLRMCGKGDNKWRTVRSAAGR